jgi:acyl carrier protein
MVDASSIENKIISAITPIFRIVFEDDNLEVSRELDASKVENWDSLNHITLIVELEQTTHTRFTIDELAAMAKVGDLIDVLISKGYRG